MQAFVDGLTGQCDRHGIDAELVMVEWNPPPGRPPLVEALQWPGRRGRCDVRVITVPAERHAKLRHSDKLPLFQMIGKNVGIRRARGRFVLATNIDILFNDPLCRHLSRGSISDHSMIRIDRWDTDKDVPTGAGVDAMLKYAEDHVLRVNRRLGTVNLATGRSSEVHWPMTPAEERAERALESRAPRGLKRPLRLHTNTCGDFTMLPAEGWSAIRGYPELELYSMHLDSLGCYQAHHAGYREVLLPDPMRAYHIEHATGSGWSPEGESALYGRLDRAGIGRLEWDSVYNWALEMRRRGSALQFNGTDWGMGGVDLSECSPWK